METLSHLASLSPSPSVPLVLRLDITLADLSLTLSVFLCQENLAHVCF